MADLSFDTSFLIDFQRERTRSSEHKPAHRFLERHADAIMAVTTIALGELMEGFEDQSHPIVELVVSGHEILPVDLEAARHHGQIARFLRASGRLIGSNDLWIAAVTRRHGIPLVTSDEDHFRRVPDLELRSYR